MNTIIVKYRKLILLLSFFGLMSCSYATYGGQPGAFLNYGSNARSIGLGRAFVALCDDSSGQLINPAGMVQVPAMEGSFFQSELWTGYKYTAFNFVYPMVDNHVGFYYLQLASNPMEGRDHNNEITNYFTDEKKAIGVSYGQQIFLPNLSIGFGAKYVSRTLDVTDKRILADVAFLFKPLPIISVGASIQNLVELQLDKNSTDKFKPTPRVGVAYKDRHFAIAYDVESELSNWYVGMEYKLHPLLTLRGGVNYESVNMGFSSEVSGIRFDYAYSSQEQGANNLFSVNMSIGNIIQDYQNDVAVDWYQQGVEKYQEGFFLLALEDMRKAYILNPNDEEISKKISKLKKLEQLSDKLKLDINVERAIWPKYKEIKGLIDKGSFDRALNEINTLIQKYPENPNLINLKTLINNKIQGE